MPLLVEAVSVSIAVAMVFSSPPGVSDQTLWSHQTCSLQPCAEIHTQVPLFQPAHTLIQQELVKTSSPRVSLMSIRSSRRAVRTLAIKQIALSRGSAGAQPELSTTRPGMILY
ncbi:unnamed protein product [Leuciscus chuanchicus]